MKIAEILADLTSTDVPVALAWATGIRRGDSLHLFGYLSVHYSQVAGGPKEWRTIGELTLYGDNTYIWKPYDDAPYKYANLITEKLKEIMGH